MTDALMNNANHHVVAQVEVDPKTGMHTIRDQQYDIIGYYDPLTNRTTDENSSLVGHGYLLPDLISREVIEEKTVGTTGTLNADQARKRSKKMASLQNQMRDQQQMNNIKMRALKDKISSL